MSVRLYDEALMKKFRNWVKDPNTTIISPNATMRLFEVMADNSDDAHPRLPLITLTRDQELEILDTGKKPLTFDAMWLTNNENRTMQLNGVPIKLNYSINIYTKYFAEADEYVRNFVYNLINYPTVTVDIPYNNSNIQHKSAITLSSTVKDNTDTSFRLSPDQFSTWQIDFEIPDAYIWSVPVYENTKIADDGIKIQITKVDDENIIEIEENVDL